MAARRLIIVMLVLLGVSTALAIVTPAPPTDDPQEEPTTGVSGASGTTGSTGAGGSSENGGDDRELGLGGGSSGSWLVEATVKPGSRTNIVRAGAGDRLILTIQTEEPAIVEIPDLGLTQTTSEFAPAVFDVILPAKPERIEVTTVDGKQPVAVIDTGI